MNAPPSKRYLDKWMKQRGMKTRDKHDDLPADVADFLKGV